eukprot:scaffold18652_cov33-Tisochrysis_lutea.AAC.1
MQSPHSYLQARQQPSMRRQSSWRRWISPRACLPLPHACVGPLPACSRDQDWVSESVCCWGVRCAQGCESSID